ncbi:MAG: hypothetical protein LBR29_07355 [Methylobacteriaceae bacterium]|nr:hypothetical protein [Methylobacteriaceae bacterium]
MGDFLRDRLRKVMSRVRGIQHHWVETDSTIILPLEHRSNQIMAVFPVRQRRLFTLVELRQKRVKKGFLMERDQRSLCA